MSNLPANRMDAVEAALVRNDISKLTKEEKMAYVDALCESTGLNKYTKPFAFLTLQGREVVYATKDCSEQLRKIHGVSTQIVRQGVVDDCYEVQIKAQDRTGRQDEDFASIPLGNLKGADLSNLKMKCVTKAKRRVTLSICGLGVLDESELDTIAASVKGFADNPQITNPLKEVSGPPLIDTSEKIDAPSSVPELFQDVDYGNYVVKGGKFDKKKLQDLDVFELGDYVRWVKEKWVVGKNLNEGEYGVYQDFMNHAEPFLSSLEFDRDRMK